MLVRYRYLKRITSRLNAGRLSVSDAILSALKLCRGAISESSLRLLNRELLGYLSEESEVWVKRFNQPETIAPNWEEDAPVHRLLSGSWVLLSLDPLAPHSLPEGISKDQFFYSDGICELEALLDRVSISDHTWICVSTDSEKNRVFMCTTAALQSIYDLARGKLCEYLEDLAQDVLTASINDSSVEARLILLLTRRGV